jgi:hypothetical protein
VCASSHGSPLVHTEPALGGGPRLVDPPIMERRCMIALADDIADEGITPDEAIARARRAFEGSDWHFVEVIGEPDAPIVVVERHTSRRLVLVPPR